MGGAPSADGAYDPPRQHMVPGERRRTMRMKTWITAVVATLALVGAVGGVAWSGEVTGRPGIPGEEFSGSGVRTGAPAHANSICAYNGLNDMNPDQGPIDSFV